MKVTIKTDDGSVVYHVPGRWEAVVVGLLHRISDEQAVNPGVRLRLTALGTKKIPIIKTLRQVFGWTLKEAKKTTDLVPVTLPPLTEAAAEDAYNELTQAGTTVTGMSAVDRLARLGVAL